MRYSVCGLLLCTACTRLATPQQAVSSSLPPTCVLQAFTKPISFNSADTRAAMRAFDQQTSAPYSALYIRKVPGRGEQASSCIRVVQRSAIHFVRYTYRAQHVDSVRRQRELAGYVYPASAWALSGGVPNRGDGRRLLGRTCQAGTNGDVQLKLSRQTV